MSKPKGVATLAEQFLAQDYDNVFDPKWGVVVTFHIDGITEYKFSDDSYVWIIKNTGLFYTNYMQDGYHLGPQPNRSSKMYLQDNFVWGFPPPKPEFINLVKFNQNY